MAEEKIKVEVVKLWTENIDTIFVESGITPKIKMGDIYVTTGTKREYLAEVGNERGWLTTAAGVKVLSGRLISPSVNGYAIVMFYDTEEFALLDGNYWRILQKDILSSPYLGVPGWLWILIAIIIIVIIYLWLRMRK